MNPINTRVVFDAVSVTKNTTSTSRTIELNQAGVTGTFSLQVAVTGDGTLTFKFTVSNDGQTFITPTGASDIKAGMTKTGGPGGDGKDIYTFTPPLAKFLRITATETVNSAAAVVTATLAYQ
jgi:hypothetical protein